MTRSIFHAIIQAAIFALPIVPSLAETEGETFRALLDAEWQYVMETSPEFATFVGYPDQNGRWTDWSPEAYESRRLHARELVGRVAAIDRGKLSPEDQLNYDLFGSRARMNVEGQRFPGEFMPVDQMSGVQQSIPATIARMPARRKDDYVDIVSRIRGAGDRIRQEVERLRKGLELGVTPPQVSLHGVPDQIRNQIVEDPLESPLLRPFTSFPSDFTEEVEKELADAAARAYEREVRPAYEALYEFMVNEYMPRCRKSIAATDLPDGEDWYAFDVRRYTTTDMTPKKIHELGQREVKRIRAEMDAVISRTGFEGPFDAFLEYLRTDPRFYYEDPEALLRGYRDIAKRIDPGLTKLFGKLPRLPYGVIAVPSYSEESQTTAYYESGSPMAGRPGYFFANTYNLPARPKWEMEALTAHEAVPGHHLQIALAQELEDLPAFRKYQGYTAFVEGWGLYAESLGEEIGLYQDPYSKFGQLTYEMWRAVRLVVDTGMHALGWTRDEAIAFFLANSSKPRHDIVVEIDRYIVWPGQALAYKIGELKYKELRSRAREALGENFDLRSFHDAVLANGALPLDVLETIMDRWIGEQSAQGEK